MSLRHIHGSSPKTQLTLPILNCKSLVEEYGELDQLVIYHNVKR